jgi:hypothetical protein
MSEYLMGHITELTPDKPVDAGVSARLTFKINNPWHRVANPCGTECVVEFYRVNRGIHLGYRRRDGNWISHVGPCGVIPYTEVSHWREYRPEHPPQELDSGSGLVNKRE